MGQSWAARTSKKSKVESQCCARSREPEIAPRVSCSISLEDRPVRSHWIIFVSSSGRCENSANLWPGRNSEIERTGVKPGQPAPAGSEGPQAADGSDRGMELQKCLLLAGFQ